MNYEFFGVMFVLIIYAILLYNMILLFFFIIKYIFLTIILVYVQIFYLDNFRDKKLTLKEKVYTFLKVAFNFRETLSCLGCLSVSNLYYTIILENRIFPKLIKHKNYEQKE